ncbi:tetratricopeptide repeat protein [Pseudobacter ginsenosidimutans]|jgi:tetratricopeptide (TPR) repeat protein|uniref:Tetratricopeptide repeat protein n=1 Tax=Pseudobacter ginsenosidimutans TaxID=661488 RepID=A0A4Q7MRC5_9BACT|nr:tetratricopeptide repeat protein [Pseudobacter ginsenosidimutans]QEC45673.1 tetratricopeptide repeat protein [Pseudobacter ginsenosidimutans]RZS69392.1 tetratricopeptide repeat protein [Pseudobacter ginsenosidimutans]
MRDNPSSQNNDEIKELVKQFQNLKNGKSHSFLDEESFEKIIDYYDDEEDLQQALVAAEMGIELFPYSSILHIKKADLLIATRHYHEALTVLSHAAVLDSNDINLYILKTAAYLALDQQDKAVALLENALELFEGQERIELLFELADVYDDYEEFDKIFDCLKLILEQDPTNEEALYKICFWTDSTGRNEESIRLHNQIIDEHPYSELAWFNLAAAYQGLKLYEKAIDAYKYAVVIDEKFDYAYRNMGDAYIRLRKYKDAIEVLEKVLELSRPEDVIYEAIGHCFDRMKNYAQARFYYRKASHLNQEDSKLYFKIACTYMNEGQWGTAIKQLETAMQIHRLQPEYNLAMGECKMQLGDYKEAIQYFSNVVGQRPRNVTSWESLIRCLYHGEFYEEALEQVHAALHMTNNKPVFRFYLSAVYLALGKTKEALLQLENAMGQSPRLLKKIVELDPSILQHQLVADIVARFKKNK